MKITREEYLKAVEIVKQYVEDAKNDIENAELLFGKKHILINKNMQIGDAGLTYRAMGALSAVSGLSLFDKVGDLDDLFTFKQLKRTRNCGDNTIREIKEYFKIVGINFKKEES